MMHVYPCPHVYESLHSISVARGGHSHMCHISGCNRGHRRLLGVVTGSPKDFWRGHRVTEDFWVGSQGHQRVFGVVTGLRRFFSTVACSHGAVLCSAMQSRVAHTCFILAYARPRGQWRSHTGAH